ncbi:MAG: energy-coupling factor transporter ATPase [Clostridia bacterium]|nr:energy-coupling factor transporter ATPase [Clostridia bacterium]
MSHIKVDGLSYTYSNDTAFAKAALNNVSFEINKGEIVGIIGHTGSGKSTLVQHLNGLIKPQPNKVFLNGADIVGDPKNLKAIRFKVGLVFQYPEYQLFEETVYKDIAFGPKNMKLSDEEIKLRVYESAKLVGIDEELLYKSPFDLSGGQKRRVAIAGVIAMAPEVIIFDEPTAGLDPVGRETIFKMIYDYRNLTNATVIIISHSMEDMALYAERVMVLNKGEIAMFDKTEKVFANVGLLKEIGLNVPQITEVFLKLRECGINISSEVFTVKQAVEAIKAYMNGGDAND